MKFYIWFMFVFCIVGWACIEGEHNIWNIELGKLQTRPFAFSWYFKLVSLCFSLFLVMVFSLVAKKLFLFMRRVRFVSCFCFYWMVVIAPMFLNLQATKLYCICMCFSRRVIAICGRVKIKLDPSGWTDF